MEDTATVQVVDPLGDPGWDQRVQAFPEANVFHSAAWARVLRDTYGFLPRYFLARDRRDETVAVVPTMEVDSWLTGRRGLTLPFTDECVPLSRDAAALRDVRDAVTRYGRARRWRYWEIRGELAAADAEAPADYLGHRLALCTDPARLFARCDSAARRAVRKAGQSQLRITFAHDLDATRAFHRLLCQTRRRHGLPPQPLRFFENIQRHALARGHGCIVLAHHDASPVAGALFLHFGGIALFKFGASDAHYQHLRPNNLVMWRAIDWHARAGFRTLDFGRTSLGHDGLRRFKLAWGAEERRIHYTRLNPRTAACSHAPDRTAGWHTNLFRLLPLAASRIIGAAAYKHVA